MVGREIGDERRLRRPLKRLAEPEDERRADEDERSSCSRQPDAAAEHDQRRHGKEEAHQREGAHPAAALERLRDRQLDQHDQQRVREPHRPDPALADAGVVLGERRQQSEDLVADRDEEHVQPQQPDEVAVAEDGAVPECAPIGLFGLLCAALANGREHRDEDEKGRRIEQKQGREAAGMARARDQPAGDASQAEAEVHADPLQREG